MLKKVYETPSSRSTSRGLRTRVADGPEFVKWLEGAEVLRQELMKKGGL
jgi:hypothetical protein